MALLAEELFRMRGVLQAPLMLQRPLPCRACHHSGPGRHLCSFVAAVRCGPGILIITRGMAHKM